MGKLIVSLSVKSLVTLLFLLPTEQIWLLACGLKDFYIINKKTFNVWKT